MGRKELNPVRVDFTKTTGTRAPHEVRARRSCARECLPGSAFAAALALPAASHDRGALDFVAPRAGSYRLPPIQACPDGEVLDDKGRARSLSEFTRGRITVVGLVYTRCADAEACPRATWAFGELRRLLRADPALQARVRLVTLSFDPAHDHPEVMAAFATRSRGSRSGAEVVPDDALGLALETSSKASGRTCASPWLRRRYGHEDFTHS